MGAQFGRWNFDGASTPPTYLDRVRSILRPYGPDGESTYRVPGVDLLYFAFETTKECAQQQPLPLDSGEMLLWDGRLDNGQELVRALGCPLTSESCDLDVVAAAWSRWRQECFSRLIGDWAISLWNPQDRFLVLATDILATHHLCYAFDDGSVQWSSVPDPLILLSERRPILDEEYLAGWLGSFPAPHLTPFREIHRVPPASLVLIRPGKCTIRRYWDLDGTRRIRYAKETEYEEHFLGVFRQSVRRRLRSTAPVLAELSGGMDSSSIVCVADQLTSASCYPAIDTISYYNDSEPHWNERPWFQKVEAQRGRVGIHIDTSSYEAFQETLSDTRVPCWPGARILKSSIYESITGNRSRVILSGIGGDEFLGGVPTPLPELEDLLAQGKLGIFIKRLQEWAIAQRRPCLHLFRDTLAGFLPVVAGGRIKKGRTPPWLDPEFVRRQSRPLAGYRNRLRLRRDLPSVQENRDALDAVRRQLACTELLPRFPLERRYPYLDRDLLEFLVAIPREQIVRPGERRSLMRRSLVGIVPQEILDRRRKAYVMQSPLRKAQLQWDELTEGGSHLIAQTIGIVSQSDLDASIRAGKQGREIPIVSLSRTLDLERWLRLLDHHGLLNWSQPGQKIAGGNRGHETRTALNIAG